MENRTSFYSCSGYLALTGDIDSFDNIAGYWNFRPDIDGLNNIQHCNNYINPYYTIYGLPIEICAAPYEREVPIHDPDHNFAGTSYELYENWNPTNKDKPTMGGFVQRESDKYNSTPGDASFVIRAYTEKETQILAYLAQNFGFWDTYVSVTLASAYILRRGRSETIR